METKRLILTVAVLLVIVLGWEQIFNFVGRQMGWDMTARKVEPATAPSDPTPTPTSTGSTTQVAIGSSIGPTTLPGGLGVTPIDSGASDATIGSASANNPDYPLGLSIASRGAGLNAVTLNDYKRSVETADPYVFETPYGDHEDQTRPLTTRFVTIDGQAIDISTASWKLDSSDAHSATYSLELNQAGKPLVRLRKTFEVYDRKDTGQGSGYEVQVNQDVQNLSARPISVSTTFVGPTSPPRELERGVDRQVISGYLPRTDEVQLAHHTVEEFTKDKASKDLTKGDADAPLAWAGACSIYFNAIVRPDPAKPSPETIRIGKLTADALNPDADAQEHLVTLTFETTPKQIMADGSASLPLRVFFGPKLRSLLKSDYYSKIPLHFDGTLVMTGGPCAYCTSDALINVLVKLLGFFHTILRDWGLAIIALVCLVRSLLHPIMKRSQANMMKMGQMQPEIERLKKKYGDDKDAVAKAQMEMMKAQGFTPILGCLPLFLQMPIFIALWSCLQSTFELRQAPFLNFFGHHLTWIKDLAQPDKLFYFPNHPVNFFFIHFDALNLLPLLVAVVSFINQKVTPKPPAATPEAAQQQKMMQWMTLIFPLMFYNLPSGLNLYYVTSTSIGILEGKIIRRHIKEKEEAAKAGRVIIDAKPTRASKMSKRDDAPPPAKPKGIMGFIANLQAKAAEMQKEAERQAKDKKSK